MKRNVSWRFAWLAGLSMVWAGAAGAVQVYSDTLLATGPEYATSIGLSLPSPGNYSVTATDLRWLNASLEALSFGVYTATAPLSTAVGAGTLEFFNAGYDKLFLQVYVKPAAGKSAALVGLKVDAAVVPLPASAWLLLSALGAFSWWRRRV